MLIVCLELKFPSLRIAIISSEEKSTFLVGSVAIDRFRDPKVDNAVSSLHLFITLEAILSDVVGVIRCSRLYTLFRR